MAWKILARIPVLGHHFRSPKVSAEDAATLCGALQARYQTKIVPLDDESQMKDVRDALQIMRVPDEETFLGALPLALVDRIYLPFIPGSQDLVDFTPWLQMRYAVHVHSLALRSREAAGLWFDWKYLTSSADRAAIEVDAWTGEMAFEWRLQQRKLDPVSLASLLPRYGCTPEDVDTAEDALWVQLDAVKRGFIPDEVVKFAVDWVTDLWRDK